MKSITIKGKKAWEKLRLKPYNAAGVPCVIYGGDQPVHFSAEAKVFKDLVYTQNAHTVVMNLKTENHSMQFYKTFRFGN
jgi:large subunit ribosomal protein L25